MPRFRVVRAATGNIHRCTVVEYTPLAGDFPFQNEFQQHVLREFERLIPPMEQYEDAFSSDPVKVCVYSLVQHARAPFYASSKPHSVSCQETLQYRFDPCTFTFGINAECEVKTLCLTRSRKKGGIEAGLHIHVMPSHCSLAKKETQNASMFAVERIGLAAGVITPVIVLAQLAERHRELGSPLVHVRLDFDARTALAEQAHLANNLGAHTLSCTVPTADYLRGMDSAFTDFAHVIAQFPGPASEVGEPPTPATSPVSPGRHPAALSHSRKHAGSSPISFVGSHRAACFGKLATGGKAAAVLVGVGSVKIQRSGGRRCESLSSLELFEHFQRKSWE